MTAERILSIYSDQCFQVRPDGVAAFVSSKNGTFPLEVQPDALPFSTNGANRLTIVDPLRGLTDLDDLRAKADIEITEQCRGEGLPLVGRAVTGLRELRRGEEGAKQWLVNFAERCFVNGLIRSKEELDEFVKKMSGKDSRWMHLDFSAAFIEAGLAWAINAAVPLITFLTTKDSQTTALATAVSVGLTPALVRNIYLGVRLLGWEGKAIYNEWKQGRISDRELATYALVYLGMGAGNFITFFPYLWQAVISLPRNREIAPYYTKLEFLKLVERMITIAEKTRSMVLKQRNDCPYGVNREPYLYRLVEAERETLKNSSLPILTAAEVGHAKVDLKTTVLSRAHQTQALAFAQFHQDEGQLTVVDVAKFLPARSNGRLEKTGRRGEKVARSAILGKAHELAAPVLRRILKLDGVFEKTVAYFMGGIAEDSQRPRPVITFHYGVGNAACEAVVKMGRTDIPIVHFVTDPFVVNGPHPPYLEYGDKEFVYYFVFDDQTRQSFIKAGVDKKRVFAVGYPVAEALDTERTAEKQQEYGHKPNKKLKVAVCTGGLGGQQHEIEKVASSLEFDNQQAVFYCGTHNDLAVKIQSLLEKRKVSVRIVDSKQEQDLTVQDRDEAIIIIGDCLDELIPLTYQLLNWAQIVCTKTSGDFGIESLIAGKLTVSLGEWGRHEKDIKTIIEASGGLINIKDLSGTGAVLSSLYKKGQLLAQVRRLWRNLDRKPPFNDNWKNSVNSALQAIQGAI